MKLTEIKFSPLSKRGRIYDLCYRTFSHVHVSPLFLIVLQVCHEALFSWTACKSRLSSWQLLGYFWPLGPRVYSLQSSPEAQAAPLLPRAETSLPSPPHCRHNAVLAAGTGRGEALCHRDPSWERLCSHGGGSSKGACLRLQSSCRSYFKTCCSLQGLAVAPCGCLLNSRVRRRRRRCAQCSRACPAPRLRCVMLLAVAFFHSRNCLSRLGWPESSQARYCG